MVDESVPITCRECNDRIGLYEPVYVVDGEGHAVAANATELYADDARRYRGRVLHIACARDAGLAVAATR